MPDLLYYPSLNTFTRTPDADSYILFVDQSGVNPALGRFPGDEISKGINAVTSNISFFDGSGTVALPLSIENAAIEASNLINLSITTSEIANAVFTPLDVASDNTGVLLNYLGINSTNDGFEWRAITTITDLGAGTSIYNAYDSATGILSFKRLAGGTNITITEASNVININAISPPSTTTVTDLGSGTAFNIDTSVADVFIANATGATTITASNFTVGSNNGKFIRLLLTENSNTITFSADFDFGNTPGTPDLAPSVFLFVVDSGGLKFVEKAAPAPAGSFNPSQLPELLYRIRAGFGYDAETGQTRASIANFADPTIETAALNGEDVFYFDRGVGNHGLGYPFADLVGERVEVHMLFEFDRTYPGFTTSNTFTPILVFPASDTSASFNHLWGYPVTDAQTANTANQLDLRVRNPGFGGGVIDTDYFLDAVECRDETDTRNFYAIFTEDATNGDTYINGTAGTKYSTQQQNFGQPSITNFIIGCFANGLGGSNSNHANFRLAELLITQPLSTSDREKVEGYFAHLYGQTAKLPGGHPYKVTAP